MKAYYNEIDPFAAEWLRQLIKAGHIAPGEVDERSIVDVRSDDLRGYGQCHFFAGVGGWSLALRLAGWDDKRPVWTGSCPCQGFSNAGQRRGFADERHLWPAWFRLIREFQPAILFGEQVDGAVRHGWLDLVQTDLEGEGYAIGAAVLGAHSVGAPHIRQRLYFGAKRLADTGCGGRKPIGHEMGRSAQEVCGETWKQWFRSDARDGGATGGLADANGGGSQARPKTAEAARQRYTTLTDGGAYWTGALNGFWRDADWLFCRDGKWRPAQPGIQCLAHGVPARVGRLRAYGNSIVPQVAAEFIIATGL